jgi:hypothetical protein
MSSSESNPSLKGIDIQEALSILSARNSEDHHSHSHTHDNNDQASCCHGAPAPESAKSMGQTIDLTAPNSQQPPDPQEESNNKEQQEKLEHERQKIRQEIQLALESLAVKDLLQAVLTAQQDRVAAYRDYEK